MKRWLVLLGVLWLAGCMQQTAVPTVAPLPVEEIDNLVLDATTGLPFNPEVIPQGSFIVEGPVNAVNVIPQDKPLFKVKLDNGVLYQINAQPLPQITMADGSEVAPHQFQPGMVIRAMVTQGAETGLGGEPVLTSTDLTVISLP